MEDPDTKVQEQGVPPPVPPESDPQPQPDPAPPPEAGSSSEAEPSAEPAPSPEEDGYPDFEPLEGIEGEPEGEAPPAPAPEPFTGQEIASGVAFAVMWGVKISTPEEQAAFEKAFMGAVPVMPTPLLLDTLKVGEALAAYGIHKGMTGPADLSKLPAWLRILIGAAALGWAAVSAARAVMEVRSERKDSDSTGHVPAGERGPGPVPAEA